MAKKILAALVICVALFTVFNNEKPKPVVEKNERPAVEEYPSEEGGALAAASTDLSVVLRHRKTKPVINIGVILPLGGSDPDIGNSLKNALLLAEDDLKFQQNSKYNYRFAVDAGQNAAAAYEKQKNTDKVNAVISFGADAGNIISPLAENDKILHVNFGAVDKKIAQGKYNFMIWTMPEQAAERLADFYEEKNWKNIAFIGTDEGQKEAVQKLAEKHGIKITSFDVETDEKDFFPVLQKSKEIKADAYLVQIESKEAENFIKQYKETGISVPLTNIETFAALPVATLSEGYCFADVAQSMDIFNNRVRQAYPDTKSDFALGTIYDTVMFLVQTFENAETPDQAIDVLADTPEYDGAIGPVRQNKDNIFDSRAIVKCIVNGKPEVMYDYHAQDGHSH